MIKAFKQIENRLGTGFATLATAVKCATLQASFNQRLAGCSDARPFMTSLVRSKGLNPMPDNTHIDIEPTYDITHPYLYAWDCMMGSYDYWKGMMQMEAQASNAPYNAIYRSSDHAGWVTFDDIEAEGTRRIIAERVRSLEQSLGLKPNL